MFFFMFERVSMVIIITKEQNVITKLRKKIRKWIYGMTCKNDRWGVVMVILIGFTYCVNVRWHIHYCNKWWGARGRYDKYIVLRPITNTHENILSTGCGSVWKRIWLMEEDGTYVTTVVMVDGGKYGASGVVWCYFFFVCVCVCVCVCVFVGVEVTLVLCMGRSLIECLVICCW